jgi:hypothetical protein
VVVYSGRWIFLFLVGGGDSFWNPMGRKNNTQTRRGLKMGLIFFVVFFSLLCVCAALYIVRFSVYTT